MKMLLQALSILILCPICVSGSGVMFSGFTEGGTYYTNGDTVTLVTCNATYNGQAITNLTWYYVSSGGDVDTGSSVLRFEDVVSETVWGDTRLYYCRANYEDNVTMSTDSSRITVIVQYNTTITVSYNNTIHVINLTVRESVRIPVMTENVELRCGVESAEWSYSSLHNQPNPLTLALFTVQFSTDFTCNDNMSREVLSVTLVAVGSGVWQQEGGSYTELVQGLALGAVVTLTEDVSLVCVTSVLISEIAWLFLDETGSFVRQTDNTEFDSNRGFLTLNLPKSLPANRTGDYYCVTAARDVSSGNTLSKTFSIQIVLPTEITTSISTTPFRTRTTYPSSSSGTTPVIPIILPILIPVISILALAVLSMLLVAVVLIALVVVRWRRRRKLGYSKAVEDEAPLEISGPPPSANLSSDNHTASSSKVPVLPRKKAAYEKLTTADRSADIIEMRDEPGKKAVGKSDKNYWYMSLDFLEIGSGQNESSSEDEIPMDEKELSQYINLNTIKHLSTEGKYANDPHATLVPLLGYKHHLSALLKEGQLEAEYEGLGGNELRYECNGAIDKSNEGKNKYRLIYPYDRSRVTLHGDSGSDYINASFISGHHVPDTFIAAQAPKPQTVDAFWQMVWQQRVATVVMLTRVVELGKEKSVRYWPEHAGTSDTYGDITVVLQKEDQCIGYATRELVLTDATGAQMKATQYHFTAWPDHDVPQLYNKLLAFTRLVKRSVNENRSPILVHCSAGVGRSGTFIALYNLMEAVGNEEAVSVYRIVNEMREYRPRMVQTFSQYRFIHLALLELLFGSTVIPSEDFTDTYKMFLQSQDEDSADVLKEQFDELCFQSDHSFSYPTTAAALPQNVEKNPVEGVVPYDDKRVVLYSPNWDCEYVNASYIGDYDLIATPLPTSSSIQEFLQLIFQLEDPLVVVLATKGEYQRIIEGSSIRVCYWLEENGTKDYEGFSVKTEKTQKSNYLIQHKMLVSSNYDNKEHPFTQFISLAWEVNGFVTEALAILNLLDQISIQKLNSPRKKLLICCSDGIGKTGVLLTAYCAISEIQSVGSVDVFQIVKQLRNFRKNIVPTIEHFISCYSLVNEYCQMNL